MAGSFSYFQFPYTMMNDISHPRQGESAVKIGYPDYNLWDVGKPGDRVVSVGKNIIFETSNIGSGHSGAYASTADSDCRPGVSPRDQSSTSL